MTVPYLIPPDVGLRLLEPESHDLAALQRVLEAAPGYAHRVMGVPPGPAEAQGIFSMLPEGRSYDDKFVFGIEQGDCLVGCVDLVRGYPDPATAMLGLLLIGEPHQGRGLGRAAYALVESEIRRWRSCDQVRIGVLRTNELVLPFWRRLGFEPNGEVKPYARGTIESQVIVMTKCLRGDTAAQQG